MFPMFPSLLILLYRFLPLDATHRRILIGDKFGYLSLLILDTRPSFTLLPIGEVIFKPTLTMNSIPHNTFPDIATNDFVASGPSNLLRGFTSRKFSTRQTPSSTGFRFGGRYTTDTVQHSYFTSLGPGHGKGERVTYGRRKRTCQGNYRETERKLPRDTRTVQEYCSYCRRHPSGC